MPTTSETTTTSNQPDIAPSVNGLPEHMTAGDTTHLSIREPNGRLGDITFADEGIVKIATTYYKNAWGADFVIQAVSAGTTTLNITVGTTVFTYDIVVSDSAATTATSTTAATTTTTETTTTETTETGMLGDVNENSVVDAADAARLLTAAAATGSGGSSGLTAQQEKNADVNRSGGFDAADAALILQYAAAVGSGFHGTMEEYLR